MTMPQVATAPGKADSPVERGLQRLAGAVLIQALQDASSGPRRFREEALEWINGKTTSGMTFEFCCSLLGRDPKDVKQRLQNKNFIPKFEPEAEMSNAFPTYGSNAYPAYLVKSASA